MSDELRWQSTTPYYTRFITDSRYRKLRPSYQRWYRPICDCVRLSITPKQEGPNV